MFQRLIMVNSFGDHYITPLGIIDQNILDRIKRKVMKKEILRWNTIDPAKRDGFEILNEIRSNIQRQGELGCFWQLIEPI